MNIFTALWHLLGDSVSLLESLVFAYIINCSVKQAIKQILYIFD